MSGKSPVRILPTATFLAASLLLLIGERILVGGSQRIVAFVVIGMLAVALALRIWSWRTSPAVLRRTEGGLLALLLLGLLALGLYALQTDALLKAVGILPAQKGEPATLPTILRCLWPIVYTLAALPLLLIEVAYAPMRRTGSVEQRRIGEALAGALSVACAVAFLFVLNYLAGALNWQTDWSYFRTARPSEATRDLLGQLEGTAEVHLFFPKPNEVLDEVQSYFQPLEVLNPRLEVFLHDRYLEPDLARTYEIRSDGVVVLVAGERHEQWTVGTEMNSARHQLSQLDRKFHEKFVRVLREPLVAYRTVGHAEAGSGLPGLPAISEIIENLRLMGFEIKPLGLREGLGTAVPEDAQLVLLLGPRGAFLPEEDQALADYAKRGGRLLLALDPQGKSELPQLLATLGLQLHREPLLNEQYHLVQRRNNSDRVFLITGSFSSHPIVSSLVRDGRAGLLLAVAGSLTRQNTSSSLGAKVEFPVRAMDGTWADSNHNFEFDEGSERHQSFDIAAVVSTDPSTIAPKTAKDSKDSKEPRPMRAVVVADGEVFADLLMVSLGNQLFAQGTLRWLAGQEDIEGPVTSEQDLPVEHSREQDVAWFYGTVFAMPVLILALGLGYIAWQRRRVRRSS